ncbi:AAA family ATPase [[Pseudopropionibacterium] massiliense]|uniref:AAA family ATPase n=1 Tax=[Pseudopropionibacterium] massiliense TaxID=2220000 RepID=UPI00102F9572
MPRIVLLPCASGNANLKPLADEVMRTFPAMMLLGARQVGKSTLTHLLDLPHARYATLDDAVTLSSAREDPIGFVASPGSQTLVIDELQRYPELLLEIKAGIDRERRPGRLRITALPGRLRRAPRPGRFPRGAGTHRAFPSPVVQLLPHPGGPA